MVKITIPSEVFDWEAANQVRLNFMHHVFTAFARMW
jgi:hypothetical protein